MHQDDLQKLVERLEKVTKTFEGIAVVCIIACLHVFPLLINGANIC